MLEVHPAIHQEPLYAHALSNDDPLPLTVARPPGWWLISRCRGAVPEAPSVRRAAQAPRAPWPTRRPAREAPPCAQRRRGLFGLVAKASRAPSCASRV